MGIDDDVTTQVDLGGKEALSVDRAQGCIVGLAVGDALGYPHEFRSRIQVRKEIAPEGITTFIRHQDKRFTRPVILGPDHPPGTYTDDTQMTLALALGILEAGTEANIDKQMQEVAKAFVAWANDDDNDRSPGETCMRGCRRLEAGDHWAVAGVAESKGCGSVMRVAPMGLAYDNLDDVMERARAQSLLTHGHAAALEASAAIAAAVFLAGRGVDPGQIHAIISDRCNARSKDFARVWKRIPSAISQPPDDVLIHIDEDPCALGEGWVGEEAAAVAMYCLWKYPNDFRSAVIAGANTDGDSDSTACLAGALVGARVGWSQIPPTFRDDVEDALLLKDVGTQLHAFLLRT